MNQLHTESGPPPGWPVPDPGASQHSQRLIEYIRDEIAVNGGHIAFERFMELALYAPGLGYYSAGAAKLGAAGDFVTAPEISPLFSCCLARQCEQILAQLGGGIILELGAGSGVMAADLIADLQRREALPAEYWILETGADLRQRQQQLLQQRVPAFFPRIRWLDTLPPAPINGIIIANEVLDALPVHRVVLNGGKVSELRVVWRNGRFTWKVMPAYQALAGHVEAILSSLPGPLPEGYCTEFNTRLQPLIAGLADSIGTGIILFIDYGYPRSEYYHPQRNDGTLLCHYRHRAHCDPFQFTGLQDITASVDFTAVAEAAVASGLQVKGFATQTNFLLSCGLDQVIGEYSSNDKITSLKLAQQVKILTLPAEMGERFKAIALSKDYNKPLLGFRLADHRQRL